MWLFVANIRKDNWDIAMDETDIIESVLLVKERCSYHEKQDDMFQLSHTHTPALVERIVFIC